MREYVPGRFIVKFADTLSEPADVVHDLGLSFASETPARGEELDQMHKKHHIQKVQPLFRALLDSDATAPGRGLKAQRKRQFEKHLASVKARYPKRNQRASKESSVPDLTSIYVFETSDSDIETICKEYAANPNVVYATPVYRYSALAVPNDPYFFSSGSWGFGYSDLWGHKKIGVQTAWGVSQGEGAVVAVVDTGLDYQHPDIIGNVWSNPAETNGITGVDDDNNGFVDDRMGWNYVSGNNEVMDDYGHGTHVAGTIAAVGDNGIGVVGIAYRAKIMPVKGLDDNGYGSTEGLAKAMVYAATNGADVMNNSWGGYGTDPAVEDAVRTANALGCVVVAAAGNDAMDAVDFTPANIEGVVTVGATGTDDTNSYFSNFGYMLDLVAPGGGPGTSSDEVNNILSLRARAMQSPSYTVANDYLRLAGTSMAAPHVAGVAALLISANPNLTRDQIVSILRHSADDRVGPANLDTAGFDKSYGWGRLNAARALSMAFAPPPDPAIMKIPPKVLDFHLPHSLCGESPSLGFDIFNLGGGTLTWSATTPPWVTMTPQSGTTHATPRITVSGSGNQQGVVDIFSAVAGNAHQQLPVSKTVLTEVRIDNCDVSLSRAYGNQGWSPSWNNNAPGIPDGQGGAIYAFNDVPDHPTLSVQRIDSHGNALWQTNGSPLAVPPAGGAANQPALASDGAGGAIIAYIEGLNTGDDSDKHLKVQRIDAGGNRLWGEQGIWISQSAGGQTEPRIVADGAGGATFVWRDQSTGNGSRIRAQRVDAAGKILWQDGGVRLAGDTADWYSDTDAALIADGNGGAFVAWTVVRYGHRLTAQHIGGRGDLLWGAYGLTIADQGEGGVGANMVSDGAGGMIIAWHDYRNFPIKAGVNYLDRDDIFAVRLNSAGQHLWNPAGVSVVTGLHATPGRYSVQWQPTQLAMVSDGAGGAIMAWHDNRNADSGGGYDIYAQRLDGNGATLWGSNGTPLATGYSRQESPALAADGSGGAYFAWHEPRSGEWDILAQHINAQGVKGWGAEGLWLQSWSGNQLFPHLVVLAGNRLALTWDDQRNLVNGENTGTSDDFLGRVIQICTDPDGNGYYQEGGTCGATGPDPHLSVSLTGGGGGSVESSPTGILCGSACDTIFPWGSAVTLTATPEADSIFRGWGGACTGTGSCTTTLINDTQLSARFERKPYSITYSRLGEGRGTVTFTPGGSCSGDCSRYYDAGEPVTLTAAPDATSLFLGWGGSCGGTGPCVVTMDASKNVTASFAVRPASASLSVSVALLEGGAGSVESAPSGIGCGKGSDSGCGSIFPYGQTVTLTAKVGSGSAFIGWGGACSGTGGCTVTLEGDRQVSAIFQRNPYPINYSRAGSGGGTVTYAPGGSCGGDCSQYYRAGETVTLTAIPDAASSFKGWGGACYGTGPCVITVDGAKNVTANFTSRLATASFIAAGRAHSLAVIDQSVWSWGNNDQGQLGDGSTTRRTTPLRLPSGEIPAGLGSGSYSSASFAILGGGALWGWGYNSYGQLGMGSTAQFQAPAAVAGIGPVTAISAGGIHGMALKPDHTVWTWGASFSGQVGDGGTGQRLTPQQVLADAVAIAAGGNHSVAVKSDGTVWTWGSNAYGQLGDGTTTQRVTPQQVPDLAGVVAIAAGASHTVAVKGDGTVWSWGENSQGQLGDGTTTRRLRPVQVPALAGVTAVTVGDNHTVALLGDGTVWSWGGNGNGQLGNGSTSARSTPGKVAAMAGVIKISAGGSHTLALKGDNTLWGWGQNSYGQIGDGSTSNRTAPVQISFDLTAPTTTATPAGGSYPAPQTVTLSASEAASIYYTLDGSTPTTSSAVYTSPLAISATATLKYFARDASWNTGEIKSATYTIGGSQAPDATFAASATTGGVPFSVSFSDRSSGAPTGWLWDFGDSTTSTLQNPEKVYSTPGLYTVSLTVTNAAGSSTVTKSNYISVIDAPLLSLQAAYEAAVDGGRIKLRAGDLFENAVFQRDIKVSIGGGYDSPYQAVVGATNVYGKLTIRKGSISLGNVALK